MHGDSYSHGLYVIGFAALALATTAAIVGSLGRKISEANLFVGALLWWVVSMIAASIWMLGGSYLMPLLIGATIWVVGGSYLLTWPSFFGLLGLGYEFVGQDEARSARRVKTRHRLPSARFRGVVVMRAGGPSYFCCIAVRLGARAGPLFCFVAGVAHSAPAQFDGQAVAGNFRGLPQSLAVSVVRRCRESALASTRSTANRITFFISR